MSITFYKEPVPIEVQQQSIFVLTDEQRAQLEKVAHNFMFFSVQEDDKTTIYGPTLSYGSITLDADTATTRLLNEVGCAMAWGTNKFAYVDNPMMLPLFIGNRTLKYCSKAFERVHGSYKPIFTLLQQHKQGAKK